MHEIRGGIFEIIFDFVDVPKIVRRCCCCCSCCCCGCCCCGCCCCCCMTASTVFSVNNHETSTLRNNWEIFTLIKTYDFLRDRPYLITLSGDDQDFCDDTTWRDDEVSISPTFYAQLFLYKSYSQSFLYLHIRFELFLAQEYWRKCAHKMLVKLTRGVKDENQTAI